LWIETLNESVVESYSAEVRERFDVWEKSTGFGVRVTPRQKIYMVMVRVDGSQKRIEVGKYPEVSLKNARAKAAEIKKRISDGSYSSNQMKSSKSFDKELAQFQKFRETHPRKSDIVFFAEAASEWNCFFPIMTALSKERGLDVCYVTSEPFDGALTRSTTQVHSFCIGNGEAREQFFEQLDVKVMIMTMPDLNRFVRRSNENVHYIYVFHTLISSHMGYIKGAFDYYDSILCAGPYHINELRATERVNGLPKKELVECGHTILDGIINKGKGKVKKEHSEDDNIRVIIAPTYGPQSLIEYENGELCIELVDLLLSANYHVSLRPHWLTDNLNPDILNHLEDLYSEFDKFEIDRNLSSHSSIEASDIMVCDLSGVALEYAFGYLRPILYIDLPLRVRNSEFAALSLPATEVKLRELTGAVVSPTELSTVPELLQSLVDDAPKVEETLLEARNKWVFNIGKSSEIAATHIEKVLNALNASPAKPRLNEDNNRAIESILTLKNASVVYANKYQGLAPSNLKIEKGKFTVFLGPSGAGKSTLLRALNGIVPINSGEIISLTHGILDNPNIWKEHQKQTAMTFQQHQLIERHSVLQNVLLGRLPFRSNIKSLWPWGPEDKRIALSCLDRVGLIEKALERVSNLSGGQKQRVGIARALAQKPSIILADEPVASLDPTTSDRILGFLKELCLETGITLVVSLHQVDLAQKYADKIVGIFKGRILFEDQSVNTTVEKLRVLYGADGINDDIPEPD